MIFSRRNCALIVFSVLCSFYSKAQDKPIGYWESHLPYNSALGVATNGNTLFTVCSQAFFTLEGTKSDATMVAYGKESGMSDIGMQCVAYDMSTATAILVYANGNIDLFKDNTFYNIPDLKVKTVAGNKSVNQVYAENGTAYLSTSLGVLVIDLSAHNITQTFQFSLDNHSLPVNSFIGFGNYFYAATTGGLYRINKDNPALQNLQAWQRIDAVDTIQSMATVWNTLFMATRQKVLAYVNDSVREVYRCAKKNDSIITHIDPSDHGLLISEFHSSNYNGDIKVMNASFEITDTFSGIGEPLQVTQLLDNSLWVADGYYGLEKITSNTHVDGFVPPGPSDPYSFDIYANNKDLWVAHGGYNDLYHANGDRNCISNYNAGKWKAYKQYVYHPFDTLTDFIGIAKNEKNGTFYFGSYLQGLFILKPDGSYELVNQAVFDSSDIYFSNNERQVTGLALDQSDNLWVSAVGVHQLYMLSADDGAWYKYHVPVTVNGGLMVIDNDGQVWFTSFSLSGGLTVFNNNQTPDNTADDTYQHLTAGVGNGNLPSNKVLCIAKDKNNQIWVGTDNGIGIISGCNPSNTGSTCDANIPIVQYDQFAGYLFAGNNVRTIAVDGANRKWVGTDAGVWLLSPDASQIIYRFTQDNSPLPSNNIQKISVDKVTGDVYIGTAQGLVCYHSTATEGGTSNQNVITFPNPVQSGYTGTIAIRGLVANADVRITDIGGQLVYKTKALGGQAIWNGRDYTGHRPQSGVYLIFSSGSDGAQTYQGKIVFMQ